MSFLLNIFFFTNTATTKSILWFSSESLVVLSFFFSTIEPGNKVVGPLTDLRRGKSVSLYTKIHNNGFLSYYFGEQCLLEKNFNQKCRKNTHRFSNIIYSTRLLNNKKIYNVYGELQNLYYLNGMLFNDFFYSFNPGEKNV